MTCMLLDATSLYLFIGLLLLAVIEPPEGIPPKGVFRVVFLWPLVVAVMAWKAIHRS